MPRSLLLLLGFGALLLAVSLVPLAQGEYQLSWWTVDGGGETFSTGGGYSLGGTIGQPDAGVLSAGEYRLGGGFWCGGASTKPPEHRIYLPLVAR